MNEWKTIFIRASLVFATLLFTDFSLADIEVSTPYLLKLKKQAALEKIFGPNLKRDWTLNKEIAEMKNENQGEKLHLRDTYLSTEFIAKAQKENFIKHNQLGLSVGLKTFLLNIGTLNYQMNREQLIAGNRVRIKMNFSCDDVVVKLKPDQALFLFSQLQIENRQPQVSVNQIIFLKDLLTEELSTSGCYGAGGAEKVLLERIKAYFKDSNKLAALLKTSFQNIIDDEIDLLLQKSKRQQEIARHQDIHISVNFKEIDFCGLDSFCLHGNLLANINSLEQKSIYVEPKNDSYTNWFTWKLSDNSSGILFFEKLWIDYILSEAQGSRAFQFVSNTDEHSSLKKLMNSRFRQGYVWKDLRNFPKGTKLYLHSSTPMAPNINTMGVNPESGQLELEVLSLVRTLIKAPKNGEYYDYASLYSSVIADLQLIEKEQKFTVLSYVQKMKTRHEFEPSYLALFEVNKSVKESRINKALVSLFDGRELLNISRSFPLFDTENIYIEAISFDGKESIYLDLK